ncbi:MAG: sulfatase-like hydrolase/transferase [Selenomonadaceae bacterium]|nr:sulfatase-like hydrolase/transferase [Selenomonadaceae bacterium]
MRLEKYFRNIQQDLKLFFFVLALLCLYRAVFMWQMSAYMGEGAGGEAVALALWAGLRLSLKTAGAVALLSFVFSTLPNLFSPRLATERCRLAVGVAASFLFSVLFLGRFPYYREFGMTYHLQIMQGFHDDLSALLSTMVWEYGLVWRFLVVLLLVAAAGYLLRRLLRLPVVGLPSALSGERHLRVLSALSLAALTILFAVFVRYGGGFDYAHGINWENAGVTGDLFLDECILDDGQALYRAWKSGERMAQGGIEGVDEARVTEFARRVAGHGELSGHDLTPYLARQAKGARLPKPRHIFIVLGETWAQWPILEKYGALHAADGIKGLMGEENSFYTASFMPNGDFTSVAITGLVTGLSEVNAYVNYQPRSFEEVYPTAMASQFKGLGYAVDFWYGGIPAWDNINRLALAQGFDHFYGYPDYRAPKQNPWGTTDGHLFDALSRHLPEEPPTVHLIMTVSNHPPYNLDLAAEGFDLERARREAAKLEHVENPDELALELGHYWYMDKVVTDFVRDTMEKYPDSLFVITGDHAVRMNPGASPTLFEWQSVPFLLHGPGVSKDILPQNVAGGHTNIVPTLIELIAPEGYEYHSIAAPMTEGTRAGFNRDFWLAEGVMGDLAGKRTEFLPGVKSADAAHARAEVDAVLPMMRTLSWWLIKNGTKLP